MLSNGDSISNNLHMHIAAQIYVKYDGSYSATMSNRESNKKILCSNISQLPGQPFVLKFQRF